jgi:catechol 2,3-dioxygenase-like lactoylglutathione lyase family enzyme
VFDHVTIRVADRAVSEPFYEAVLRTLGVETTYSVGAFAEWRDFSLAQADAGHPVTQGLHLAFVAPSREQVDAFWTAGTEAGHPDDGPPGPRTQYREDYYGAFVRDPDGNSVEAVHHGALRHDGVLDHLWLRVADVAASTAFYDAVGAEAGFAARHRSPERATFAGDSGSFTLVPGTAPSQNVHLAFPSDEDAAIRRFHERAVAAGHRSHGVPGERPQYHPGYYAAYVLDPDGNNVELVNHHRA